MALGEIFNSLFPELNFLGDLAASAPEQVEAANAKYRAQKNLNIKPTLEIRPGYQFNVIVTKDVVFERPYSNKR